MRVGELEQMPRIRLRLAFTISALERELEWSAAWKCFLGAHRQVGLTLELVSRLQAIRALDLRDYLVMRFVTIQMEFSDDVPRTKIGIARSPLTARSVVIIFFY